ncbi:hypothetical protein Ahy_B10g104672 [Arachis hypogaea]|uniref:FAR1 domain-containing protein n=1 Tax=Arachis hypogaea TaxID=3818 RepID=A0A444X685_ARAHY|nr:hypothetical protein Ahy_B10g104672 [Arachis hypogaea]
MNESTLNQLNKCDLDNSSKTHQFDETEIELFRIWFCIMVSFTVSNYSLRSPYLRFRFTMHTSCVVDEKFVPKVGMIFKTLEEAGKFYKYYSKLADFSTKIRNTTRDGDKIKNQLIVCTREGRWKSKISPTLKTNPSAGLNCPARIYVHIMKDVGLWTLSKSKCVVYEQFIPKVGMTFKTLEKVGKFYKDYSKLADFSIKIKNTTRKGDEIKNQLITCSREGK